jgi:hypothetical protein
LPLGSRVKSIAEEVQTDARDVLGNEFYRGDAGVEIAFERDVEALILGAATVIGAAKITRCNLLVSIRPTGFLLHLLLAGMLVRHVMADRIGDYVSERERDVFSKADNSQSDTSRPAVSVRTGRSFAR